MLRQCRAANGTCDLDELCDGLGPAVLSSSSPLCICARSNRSYRLTCRCVAFRGSVRETGDSRPTLFATPKWAPAISNVRPMRSFRRVPCRVDVVLFLQRDAMAYRRCVRPVAVVADVFFGEVATCLTRSFCFVCVRSYVCRESVSTGAVWQIL